MILEVILSKPIGCTIFWSCNITAASAADCQDDHGLSLLQ